MEKEPLVQITIQDPLNPHRQVTLPRRKLRVITPGAGLVLNIMLEPDPKDTEHRPGHLALKIDSVFEREKGVCGEKENLIVMFCTINSPEALWTYRLLEKMKLSD